MIKTISLVILIILSALAIIKVIIDGIKEYKKQQNK